MRGFLSRVRTSAMCLALAGSSLLGVPQACADTYPTEAMIGVGEWWFAPILVDQPTGCKAVHSFLALSTKVDTVGNNLVAVWYVRPSTTDEVWTAWTWESSDQWDAIKYVRDTLGISESYDSVWPTSDTQYAGPGQTPVLYDKGFVETDLVGQALGPAPDRDIWIDVLKDIGYQVADVVFDKTPLEGQVVHCDQKGWLNTMATAIEMNVCAEDPLSVPGNSVFDGMVNECAPCEVIITSIGPETAEVQIGTGATPWTLDHSTSTQCCYRRSRRFEKTRTVTVQQANCTITTILQTKRRIERQEKCCDKPGSGVCSQLPSAGCATNNDPFSPNVTPDPEAPWLPQYDGG